MIEVADVVQSFGPAYRQARGASLLPSHRRALDDIVACRTERMGGQLWRCTACNADIPSYHSCRNRSCPKCHRAQTADWLAARAAEMLPTGHFHVTVTVPADLRAVMRRHQRVCYGLLMTATAEAIIELARDPRYVGGTVGILAVLHTWTRQLDFHPHVHCLVTGGGVGRGGEHWHPVVRDGFLVPVKALAKLVRGKVRAGLARLLPDAAIPPEVWRTPWVTHVTVWGTGEPAVLDYLARYVFRTAITNSRITALDDDTVSFRYPNREGGPGRWRSCTVSGPEFLRRFCQHILPAGFHRVRYYGLWHPSKRAVAARVRQLLLLDRTVPLSTGGAPISVADTAEDAQPGAAPRLCPRCGQAHLVAGRILKPVGPPGPSPTPPRDHPPPPRP